MGKFPRLNLPVAPRQVMVTARGLEIYDPLRRRAVMLTPEEWVRQHFTAYLCQCLGYPPGRMGNEVSITLNGASRRCDTVVFGHSSPVAIVEYKAASVPLTARVFDQVARYNMALRVPVLMVSNGMDHYACRVEAAGYRFLSRLPPYAQISDL